MANLNAIPARITAATVAAAKTAAARDKKQLALDVLEAELAAVKARIAVLEKVLAKQTATAWCADLTEDATGSVATLDLPDEGRLTLIAPAAPVPVADDGALVMREAMTGPQAYWCAAALPGVQKWRSKYRRGTITAIDVEADLADVALDSADTSSAQALGINQSPTLAGVPVQYMTCNAQAFAVGDKCVVKFIDRDWAQPRVVGFVDHPKPCEVADVHLIFWQAPNTLAAVDAARQKVGSLKNNVNFCGSVNDAGPYYTLGLKLETARVYGGMAFEDTSNAVSYQVLGFYDGKPLSLRKLIQKTYRAVAPEVDTLTERQNTLMHGTSVLLSGIGTSTDVGSNGTGIWVGTKTDVYSNYLSSAYPDGPLWHPAVAREFGPWSGWSVWAGYVQNGEYSITEDGTIVVSETNSQVLTWQTQSLGPPRKNNPPLVLADLAQMPAPLARDTLRAYVSADFALAPLDRHLLDFGYLPYTIDTLKVYTLGKEVAWTWITAANETWVNIAAVNYKTGGVVNISAPYFWQDDPLPTDWTPKFSVFADSWACWAQNDPDGPYFWLYYYTLDMGSGLTLVKTITNKPGDLSGGGHVGLVQVTTPTLPANCYLIGAMRDEVACM